MGTSQSSKGPGSNVPLVPPWVPPPPTVNSSELPGNPSGDTQPNDAKPAAPQDAGADAPNVQATAATQNASPRRFGSARTKLGSFVRYGDKAALHRGISDYVRKGYGGSAIASKRFEGTARTAGTIYAAFQSLAAGQDLVAAKSVDRAALSGRPVRDVLDAIIDAVRPSDGSQDAEASRDAVAESLSELLERFPDADLLALTPDQIDIVIERFTAEDIYRRIMLDVGKAVQSAAQTVAIEMDRVADIREYVYSVVSSEFAKLRVAGTSLTSADVSAIVRNAIANTMTVFEITRL